MIAWLNENDEDRMLNEDLTERFSGRILAVDESVAQAWGVLSAQQEAAGHPVGAIDGFLAATALIHDLTLVSRNIADFKGILPKLLNPWQSRDPLVCA